MKSFYEEWVEQGKPIPELPEDDSIITIDPLTNEEIETFINNLLRDANLSKSNLSVLLSDALHNPVDFSNPDGNTREGYEYILERNYREGETFYITAIEAILFSEYFGSQRVLVKNHCVLPLKYFIFRDYGIYPNEECVKNQIEWTVQKFYQQRGLLY